MAKKAVESPVLRLQQLLSCIGEHKPLSPSDARLSIIHGPREPELVHITLGKLLALQSSKCTNLECLVVPWTSSRWTYRELKEEADRVAKGMIAMGIAKGDRVGILAGNCEQYVSIFFATAQIGAILVLLNATYTPTELSHALDHTG